MPRSSWPVENKSHGLVVVFNLVGWKCFALSIFVLLVFYFVFDFFPLVCFREREKEYEVRWEGCEEDQE